MTFAGEFLGLPGLRGYWPMGAFDSSGNAIDQSGNARTLTYNGGAPGPLYNYTTQGGPYIDLDGTGDYLSRADEAGLDILGTESYVATAVRGLTLGGWFYFDRLAADEHLLGKLGASGQFSYRIVKLVSGNVVRLAISGNGTAQSTVDTAAVSTAAWYFIVGKYTPSTEIAIYLNGTETTATASIPASIFNSTAEFRIGQDNGGFSHLLDGRASNCFLCAMLLSDTAIDNIYQNTKASYGL